MGIYDVDSILTTDVTNTLTPTSINPQDTTISEYTPDWEKWFGIYKEIPEVSALIDKAVIWALPGIKAKEKNKQIQLDRIIGFGKDTYLDVCRNLLRTKLICGDSFGEIIKDKRAELRNLKPLSPGSMQIISTNKAMLKEYKQINLKVLPGAENRVLATWEKEEVFHLINQRIADETHGISSIEKIHDAVLKLKEAKNVMQKIIRRNAKPIVIIQADTDDDAKMASLKTKYHNLIENDEAMVIPKDATDIKDLSSKLNIDPLPWMNFLMKEFVLAHGVPFPILGVSGNDTEGEAKILALAFEQLVRYEAEFFRMTWKAQIGWEIVIDEPISIDPLILTDMRKSGGNKMPNQSGDINPGGQNK